MVLSIQRITDFIEREENELKNVREELRKAMALEEKYVLAVETAEAKYHFHTKKLDALQAKHNRVQSSYAEMKNNHAEMEQKLENHQDAHADTHLSHKEKKREHERHFTMSGAAAAALENQIDSKKKALKDLQTAIERTDNNFKVLGDSHRVMKDKLKTASHVNVALLMEKENKAKWQADLAKLHGDYVDAHGHHETWAQNHKRIQQELWDVKNGMASNAEIADLMRRTSAEKNAVKNSDICAADKIVLISEEKQELLAAKFALKTKHDEAHSKIAEHQNSFAELEDTYETMWIKYQSLVTQNALIAQQIGQSQSSLKSMSSFCSRNLRTITESLKFK